MTIAVCYVAEEGVVFGADSTTSFSTQPGGYHYFNHAQKLFEIGENSRFGVLTWGAASVPGSSHRTIGAQLADEFASTTIPLNVSEVAARWADLFWQSYSSGYAPQIARFRELDLKAPYSPTSPPATGVRTEDEELEVDRLISTLTVGFCIGGVSLPSRKPEACVLEFGPHLHSPPTPVLFGVGSCRFWGDPNMIMRLVDGFDPEVGLALLNSGKWKGTEAELVAVLRKKALVIVNLPIRDAVDFVHLAIHSTIKALKFSNLPQVCGGPIELAVVTTDRKFRWVKHKPWNAAVSSGE